MSERFESSDLREIFAKANEENSGGQLSGLAARFERERVAAKRKLADTSLAEIVNSNSSPNRIDCCTPIGWEVMGHAQRKLDDFTPRRKARVSANRTCA